MNLRKKGLIVLVIMIFFLFMGAASAAGTTKKVSLNDKKFTTVNIPFVENHGQISDKNVKYSANTFIGNVYVKDNGIVYALTKDKKGWVVSEKFVNSNNVDVKGYDQSKTKVSYYKGKNVQKNLATYSKVKYSNLYDGIDLYLNAHGKNIEKIYSIGNSGSPSSIWVTVSGSKGLKINKKGELEILNGLSALKLTKPVAYQIINGKKVNVSVSYVINNLSYGYKTGAYNKNYKLIIDPLLSSTFLSGNSYDNAQGVAVDKAGNVYVTGYTGSGDFPTIAGGYQTTIKSGEWDAFVSKFDSTLTTLISSTFIGGTYSDKATGIALDNQGRLGCNVFITGTTYSQNYPNTAFTVPWDTGAGDVFISKLSNDLTTLEASTFFGGNRADMANAIIVDASNNVYITGQTFSYNGTDSKNNPVTGFPVRYSSFNEPLAQTSYVGNGDVFVSKLDNNLASLRSGVVFGGSGTSYGTSLAVDQSNYIYVTGATNATDFPAVTNTNVYPDNGFQTNKGDYDAFVVKLSAQYLENIEGLALLGGSARDVGNGIAVDPIGRVYVVGGTWSSNMYTTLGAKQRQNNGKEDGFVVIMDKQIQNILSSTYLGGNGIDFANGVIVSDQGNIGIIGTTNSTKSFPNELPSGDTTAHGMEDVFFTTFTNVMTAQEKVETTFLGGVNADYGEALAIDTIGNIFLVGDTWSNDYPTTSGAYQTNTVDNLQYTDDAFISKIDNLLDTSPPTVGSIDPVNNSSNVQLNKIIKLVYNEQIQRGSNFDIGGGLSSITLNGVNVPLSNIQIVMNTLIITPTSLQPSTKYTLFIPVDAIEDLAGNIGDEYTLVFNTVVPLNVVSTNPVNNANNVIGNQPITITFNIPIKTGPNYALITLLNSASTKMPITKTINGNILTITPIGNLTPGTYTLSLPINSILDMNNKGLTSIFTTSFTVTSPTVTSTDPVNNAINVPTNKLLSVTFNRPIKLGPGLIQLKSSGGTVIPITFSITNNTLFIYHTTQALAKSTNYILTLNPNCITDLAGNGLATQLITTFKTANTTTASTSQTINLAPKIISTNPVNNAVNLATNKVIKINFSEAIKFGTNVVIELKTSSGKTVSFKRTISGSTLSITPTTALAKGTTYTVVIHANSVTDLAGKGLATTYTTTFKTVTV
ncbi:Ig-like domain-containing protein [Methanobacterium sp. SMA-27]|uniref:Ig-like domain-containing protein n=1 Tax=Methanobacterium sp. SMA-27 TaxID=1495336 RepID=UPI00064E5A02|nr:Ig-like domain-containing protein [Methanobacterium sp. SMA-27]